MAWWELSIDVDRARLDALSTLLFALGAAGLQEDHLPGEAPPPRQPWDVGPPPADPPMRRARAFFEDPDREAVTAHVASGLSEPVDVRWSLVEEVDWDARFRDSFRPLVISERLVIAPPWDAPDGAVIIEPGQGFGTGDHPTTRQALFALDRLADSVHTVLDLGCGSGILALAAAHLGLRAEGVDVDPTAIRDADDNARRNHLSVPFSTTPIAALPHPADLVLANLYAEVLVALAPELIRLTGEWLVLAGILAEKEASVRDALPGLRLHERAQDGEWVCLVYQRAS